MPSYRDLPTPALIDQASAWRHDFHAHPELGYSEHRTSEKVAQLLESFGLPVTRGLGGTGLVATLRRGPGPAIGLRPRGIWANQKTSAAVCISFFSPPRKPVPARAR